MLGLDKNGNQIYNELVTKALTIASVQEIGDSSIKRIYNRNYNTSESLINLFNSMCGRMADGMHVNMGSEFVSNGVMVAEDSYNIITNIVLDTSKGERISTANKRFGNNKDSVFVYINGTKVPDSSIRLYMTDSNTNVIVPKRYFNDGDNDILIERRKFENFSYTGTRVRNFSDTELTVTVSPHRVFTANLLTTMIFVNGKYESNVLNSVTKVDDTFTVKFNKIVTGDLEIFVDSSIKYINKTVENRRVVPFSIADTFSDPLNGPINKDNCLFFIDGKRISNSKISQVGRLDFQYDGGVLLSGANVTTLFTDNSLIPLKRYKLYGDDYFLYNFLGGKRITNGLLGLPTNSHFDTFLNNDYKGILGSKFTNEELLATIDEISSIKDPSLKIMELIRRFPLLLKEFLDMFAIKNISRTVVWDGVTNPIMIGTGSDYVIGSRIIRVANVNGKIAKIEKFTVNSDEIFWNMELDSKWFEVGDNIVEIYESIQTEDPEVYRVVPIDRYQTNFGTYDYRAVIDVFGDIQTLDDFKILTVTNRKYDPYGIYLDNSDYGFRVLTGSESPRIIANVNGVNKIFVSFGIEDPRIDMLIITKTKHHGIFSFPIQAYTDIGYESLFNKLSVGTEKFYENNVYHDVKVPLIHNGGLIVCNNTTGERLFKDIDYLYKSPLDFKDLRSTGVIFKQYLDVGDVISVVTVPSYTSSAEYPSLSIEDTNDPNGSEDPEYKSFGLLYLGNLRFPYSHDYVNVFANGKKILQSKIDILSNKLIRLYNECVSLKNVYVELNFSIPFTYLEPFISLYNDSLFENEIKKMFACYNFYDVSGISVTPKMTAYQYYMSFDDGVDSNKKTPNIKCVGEISKPKYNLYKDAYLRWFISDRSNHVWKGFQQIPQYVLSELEVFRESSSGDNRDVVIYPWKREYINDIVLATKPEWYAGFTEEGTTKNFLECCQENSLSLQECYERYDEFKHSNRVFKRDLLPIKATTTFDGEDIIVGRGPTKKLGAKI